MPAVTAPHVIPFLPGYIPPDVDMHQVLADVTETGVSAPGADTAALQQVVADAAEKGIDLKIVAITTNPPIDTPLRDIATEVGQAFPGSTVLAVSPVFAGTYSTAYDRVTLESGQDLAKTGDPVLSSKNFVGALTAPEFPWTALTIVLIVLVAAVATGVRLLQVRARSLTGRPPLRN